MYLYFQNQTRIVPRNILKHSVGTTVSFLFEEFCASEPCRMSPLYRSCNWPFFFFFNVKCALRKPVFLVVTGLKTKKLSPPFLALSPRYAGVPRCARPLPARASPRGEGGPGTENRWRSARLLRCLPPPHPRGGSDAPAGRWRRRRLAAMGRKERGEQPGAGSAAAAPGQGGARREGPCVAPRVEAVPLPHSSGFAPR